MSQTVKTAISGTQKILSKKLSLVFDFSPCFFFESRVILAGLPHTAFDSLYEHTTRERKSKLYTTTNLFFLSRVI